MTYTLAATNSGLNIYTLRYNPSTGLFNDNAYKFSDPAGLPKYLDIFTFLL